MKLCLALGLISTSLAAIACDPSQGVTFVNDTNQAVTLYEEGEKAGVLSAKQQKTFSFGEYAGEKSFEARDANGVVLFSEELTWEDLKSRQWRIVVRELTR